MSWKSLTRLWKKQGKQLQKQHKPLKIILRTNQEGVVEVVDAADGKILSNIKRLDIYVNTYGKLAVTITLDDTNMHVEALQENINIRGN